MEQVIIVGASGHARVVVDIFECEGAYQIVGVLDMSLPVGALFCGYPVLGGDDALPALAAQSPPLGCCVAIGDNWRRQVVAQRLAHLVPGLRFVSAIHPVAQIARSAIVGPGTVAMAGAIVNSGCRVEEHCIINTRASLDHDSAMAAFSSLAPGVTVGGDVTIGACSAIGIGASIVHGRRIGEHTLVGAGAVVVRDIPDRCVAYGLPARVVRRREPGDRYL